MIKYNRCIVKTEYCTLSLMHISVCDLLFHCRKRVMLSIKFGS